MGYFPNADLQDQFPAWRPVVAEAPVRPDLFDEHTAAALVQLQKNRGLRPTGFADQDSRDLISRAGCGIPDGMAAVDPTDKFALLSNSFAVGSTVTYKVSPTTTIPSPLTLAQVQTAADAAMQTWGNEVTAGLSFARVTGSSNITIQFGALGSSTTAQTSGGTITLNNTFPWSFAAQAGSSYDVQGIITHEAGHALGLSHSSFFKKLSPTLNDQPTMFPTASHQESFLARDLHVDDKVAISVRYDAFGNLSTDNKGARDIGVGADGSIWIISSEPFGNGFRVYKWNTSSFPFWDASDGGAVRVAVAPDGRPWVIDASGNIYRHTTNVTTSGFWELLPGNASDIGVGANGDAWVIGGWCGGGDCPIYKWSPSIANWVADHAGGLAVRITVGEKGVPWVLNSAQHFYRYTTSPGCGVTCQSSDPNVGVWELLPGLSVDLGIGPGNYLWSIGPLSSGLVSLSVWNEQDALALGTPQPPKVAAWTQNKKPCSFDATSAVAVGPRGEPYIVCNSGLVVTSIR